MKRPSHVDLGAGIVALLGIRAVSRSCEKFSAKRLEVRYKATVITLTFETDDDRDAAYNMLIAAMRELGMIE